MVKLGEESSQNVMCLTEVESNVGFDGDYFGDMIFRLTRQSIDIDMVTACKSLIADLHSEQSWMKSQLSSAEALSP